MFECTTITHVDAKNGDGTWEFLDLDTVLIIQLPNSNYEFLYNLITISTGNIQGFWACSVMNSKKVSMSATATLKTKNKFVELDLFAKQGLSEVIAYAIVPYVSSAREGVQRL